MKNVLPKLLEEYLDTTEQNPVTMSDEEILEEADWVYFLVCIGEIICSKQEKAALKRFINKNTWGENND